MARTVKPKWLILLAAFFVLSQDPAYSQDGGDPLPYVSEAPVNKKLAPKLKDLVKSALKIEKEEDGVAFVPIEKQSFANGTEILFVRTRGSRVEMIATGKVSTEQMINGKNTLLIQIQRDSVIKYPVNGDFAVLMADPMASAAADKRGESNYLKPEAADSGPRIRDPGYLQFGMGLAIGLLDTTTSATSDPTIAYPVNGAKHPKPYRFKYMDIAYYSDYIPLGFEYHSQGGVYPTSTFFAKTVATETSISDMNLYYRFKKILWNRLRIAPKISMINDNFVTDNDDESLLSTKITGFGLGARLGVDIVPETWKPEKNEFPFMIQKIYGEFTYYPSLTATDGSVSRGPGSTGSKGSEIKYGGTAMLYLGFIPVFSRWIFDVGYTVRKYDLKFSGVPLQAPQAGASTIPANATATERNGYFNFFFGFRIEDPIYLFIKGKDIKK